MAVEAEVAEVHGREDEGGDSDEDWPERDEEVCQRGVDDRWVASDVFEDVEPMSLNDYRCKNAGRRLGQHRGREEGRRTKNHVQDGKAKPNQKVDHKGAAFLFVRSHKVEEDRISRSARPNQVGG